MVSISSRDLVRRYQDASNAGDFEALDDVVAPDIATPDILPGFGQGREAVKAIARATAQAWPDFHVTIDDLVGENDQVVARITMTGTAVNNFGTMFARQWPLVSLHRRVLRAGARRETCRAHWRRRRPEPAAPARPDALRFPPAAERGSPPPPSSGNPVSQSARDPVSFCGAVDNATCWHG